jgi:hypothetical protein
MVNVVSSQFETFEFEKGRPVNQGTRGKWAVAVYQGTLYETQTQITYLLSSIGEPDSAKILVDTFKGQTYSIVYYSATPVVTVENAPTQEICAGSPVPDGWIKTNDSWNPTSCGNPSAITYNVWTITQYANLPIDSQLTVCADAPVPNGWVVINTAWDPTSCGHPTNMVNNVKTIKRVN